MSCIDTCDTRDNGDVSDTGDVIDIGHLSDISHISNLSDTQPTAQAGVAAQQAASASRPAPAPVTALAALFSATLAACGGGGGGVGGGTEPPVAAPSPPAAAPPPPTQPPPALASPTAVEASRFLAQASMGATRTHIAHVQAVGYAAWLDEQFNLPASSTRWDWLVAKGYYADIANANSQAGFDSCAWAHMLSAPDTLRERMTLALSEIFVVSVASINANWKSFGGAAFADLLQANAFGNFRSLLQQVSTSVQMGAYLTFLGSRKEDPVSGALPDENYARESMQLFTIGLQQLDIDGSVKPVNGKPADTYTLDDITGLARVFTGWTYDFAGASPPKATPDYHRRPMIQNARYHETGAKTFLGITIPAGTSGEASMALALDRIFAHPNVGPFISRQLIQRLVTSNPSPAYVARVATVFNDDGSSKGTALERRGNLRAVARALLLDAEARRTALGTTGAASTSGSGKLREPMLRFSAWARAYNVSSPSNAWKVGDTTNPATALGQSPLRSPSVFNFFRPGYVPPNTGIAAASLVAPEFQITNESSVIGYLNFMKRAVAGGIADLTPDYSSLLPLADDAAALLAEINLVLAAGALPADTTLNDLAAAVQTMAKGDDTARRNRINAALLLVLAAPEFIVQK